MNDEFDKQLVKDFPILYRDRNASMQTTCMCWGFCVGDGWYDLILTLSEFIQARMDATKYSKDGDIKSGIICVADQVKEKFGGLRFYYHIERDPSVKDIDEDFTKEMTNEIEGAVGLASRLSYLICENCGCPGKSSDDGWISVRCEPCKSKERKQNKWNLIKWNLLTPWRWISRKFGGR